MRIRALIAIISLLAGLLMACDGTEAPGVKEISREELVRSASGGRLLLDVRSPEEYAAGHIQGSLNIPHDRLAERLPEIQKFAGEPVVVFCKSGKRAALVIDELSKAGFTNLQHLTGDMDGWIETGYSITKDSS